MVRTCWFASVKTESKVKVASLLLRLQVFVENTDSQSQKVAVLSSVSQQECQLDWYCLSWFEQVSDR